MQRYNQSKNNQYRCGGMDVKEILKAQLNLQKADVDYVGKDAVTYTGNTIGSSNVGVEDVHLYFDSAYAEPTNNSLNRTIISHNIYRLNRGLDITQCMQLQIGSFYIPRQYCTPSTEVDPY